MIILSNPKYVENLGGVIRAVACFNYGPVLWTGKRLIDPSSGRLKALSAGYAAPRKERLLREFRHPDYKSVLWEQTDKPFDISHSRGMDLVPICVEVDGSEDLTYFEHPANAAYVFGPEDGSVPPVLRRHCHRFVRIPSLYCLNLAAAVNIVLADRIMKQTRPAASNPRNKNLGNARTSKGFETTSQRRMGTGLVSRT